MFAVAVISIFIFLVFLLFTFLKSKSGQAKVKYPPSRDCEAVESLFTSHGVFEKEFYRKLADDDQEATSNSNGLGFYQCYCMKYAKLQEIKDGES